MAKLITIFTFGTFRLPMIVNVVSARSTVLDRARDTLSWPECVFSGSVITRFAFHATLIVFTVSWLAVGITIDTHLAFGFVELSERTF